ncbi:MAG: hypothetical protein AAB680_07190 [Pseudomonadota bacterium]
MTLSFEKSDVRSLEVKDRDIGVLVDEALAKNGGLLRLAPCWVPRSFLHPGGRLKLDPKDLFVFGLERGGIDERWFGSTTEAANEGRVPDEGLSYVYCDEHRFTLRDAVAARGEILVGEKIWGEYGRWPVYSKFFDNMGPIPLHMHQSAEYASLIGREGKPEGYYFPPQHNYVSNNFPHTYFGLSPNTTKQDIKETIANWEKGDNGILHFSAAYKLQPGTGWLVGPGILHAPGSLCTYEPQWGSDVFAMYQNLCEGRTTSRELLVKDVPAEKADDLDHLVGQLDWDANVDPDFKKNHFLTPIIAQSDNSNYVDKWVVYGRVKGKSWFSARELTIFPNCACQFSDPGASSIIVVQGQGTINGIDISSPSMIGFYELTQDEIFIPDVTARGGLKFVNKSPTEPLVILRYFGPEIDPNVPDVGF